MDEFGTQGRTEGFLPTKLRWKPKDFTRHQLRPCFLPGENPSWALTRFSKKCPTVAATFKNP